MRHIILRVMAAAVVMACSAYGSRPNVLLVITDDQGYGDLSIHGNTKLRTPHTDRFAAQSVRFDRFQVHPVCAPTRASLLTGRYAVRGGVWGVTQDRETMRSGEITLAEALGAAGYRTGAFGKWHNGMQYPYDPRGQGFHEFFGFRGGHWNNYFHTELEYNNTWVQTQGYMPDALTDAVIRFMRSSGDTPFFCYVPYNTPHSPDELPDRYFDRYKAMGLDDHTAAAYGMCENIDDNFARLLGALDEMGVADNTIVLFMTDNGPNGQRYNAGMRGAKGSVHEGGTRVPLFIRWPGKLEPKVIDTLTAHIDLYPTLLELCSVPAPKGPAIDGMSLVPLMNGHAANWPDRRIFTHRGRREWNERYPASVRTSKYRLVHTGKAWMLFDMESDPGEERDIAADRPAVVKELADAYDRWFDDVWSQGWEPPPIPVGHTEENPVELRATQASFDKPIRYYTSPNGFANDWLTGWNSPSAKVRFDIDVVRGGRYAVELRYTCASSSAGSRVQISAPGSSMQTTVAAAEGWNMPLPVRDHDRLYAERVWPVLNAGQITLGAGRQTLVIEALESPGGEVMDLKGVLLRWVGAP